MVVEVGKQDLAIIERVLTVGHDLVVINNATYPQPPVVKRLLRKCPCPIWIMRPSRNPTQRVLAAVNPHPAEVELNQMILELASSMVERYGGELHVGHSWELYGDAPESALFNFTPAVGFEQLRDETEAASQLALDELLASGSFADAPWQTHLRHGPAEQVVPELVSEYQIDLLVMGTVARSGLDGVLIGNTAERVLDDVRCSVMAVKPPGFVSPIRVST
jgi:nucleotide-binding universal stress UspA family protein